MKLIDNILYLEFSEMLACGFNENYLSKAKSAGTKCWHFINDPEDKRKVLVGFDKLRPEYKAKVQAIYGNPYEFIAKEPIKKLVQKDFKAEEFYISYRYAGPTGEDRLKPEIITRYTNEASWLNMLLYADDNRKKVIKQGLNLDIATFYTHVTDLLATEAAAERIGAKFPTSYQKLMAKMREYRAEGYQSLIHKNYGNKNAAVIGKTEHGFDEVLQAKQVAAIRTIASQHNNFDSAQVTKLANILFAKNGWPTVKKATVYNLMQANTHLITPGRNGSKVYANKIERHVLRERPAYPLYYCTLDGWTAELLYQDETGYNNRLVIVVVLDAMNNYPVGYAIGERENAELIRQALRNAILHIREITGNWHRPHQLQSDRYAIKNLTPFYQAITQLHTPAAVGNSKSKVVEPYFNYINKKYAQFERFWSGHNLTSRYENQVNIEKLDKLKSTFPTKQGIISILENYMMWERQEKQPQYLAQWQAMPVADRATLPRENYYQVLGQTTGYTNALTGKGLCPTIGGTTLVYDTFNPAFRQNIHQNFTVYYDETNLAEVLAVAENGQRFLLEQTRSIAMDIKSATNADHEYRAQITAQNKQARQQVMETYANDALLLEEVISNTPFALTSHNEAALKLMFTNKGQQKEALQNAKGLKAVQKKELAHQVKEAETEAQKWKEQQRAYLLQKINPNKYFNHTS